MNKRVIQNVLIGLILTTLLLTPMFAAAQSDQSRSFPETGHWVTGEFLALYESVDNPGLVFGLPITDAFAAQLSQDPSGTIIQYFERARFELHPDNPDGLQVTLTMLGEYFYLHDDPGSPVDIPAKSSACRNIPEDGFPVCYAFLHFFDQQGGIAQFGYPISELVVQDGRLVQYFQRARFEWHPELPSGQRVTLTNLGTRYFNTLRENLLLLQPASDAVLGEVLELRVHAFVERAVMAPNGLQRVFVIVQNQHLDPVSGAHVYLQVALPSGRTQDFSMPLTNSNGISEVSFIVQDEPAGLVVINAEVRTSDLYVSTVTSFRIWK